MRRRIVVALVFLLAVGLCAALVWFNLFRDKMIAQVFATMQPPPQTVAAAPVATTTWRPGIGAIGTARASYGVELATQIAGLVKDIRFTPNAEVAAGTVMVQIDDAVERAELVEAEAQVKLAEAAFERSRALRTRGFDTQVAYEQAEAALAAARSRLQKLEATIDQKAIKAPFTGTPGIARINPGQYLQPGTVIATFQSLRQMRVDFTVPEQAIDKVRLGQSVRFGTSEAALDRPGKIVGIDPRVDPQTRLVAVQAELDAATAAGIVPGQFLRVRVDLPAEPNVVTVPQTAVIASLYGDYVYAVEETAADGKTTLRARQVFVKTGRREGQIVEVLSGLQPGRTVVVSGQNKLQAGAVVKIDNTIDVTAIPNGGTAAR